ncbi:CitA [Bacillus sp. NRRL B-14911]|nr:CitA [Bacillus sp. NRRL B-14911]
MKADKERRMRMIAKGLKGILAAETSVGHVDGLKGQLIYRGYEIGELTRKCSFEEAAFLLWHGRLPARGELDDLKTELHSFRAIPPHVASIITAMPVSFSMMDVLRTAVSSLGGSLEKPAVRQAVQLTALIPVMIAFRSRLLEGKQPVDPEPSLGHAANYLYMLKGQIPEKAHSEALETYLLLTMEHGMNASTFSARVTASTESDLISAITSAIGTMKGPLHGGAPSGVIELLDEIMERGDAEAVIREKLERGEKLMGFGHRIYKTLDPRAAALKDKLQQFAGHDTWLDMALVTEQTALRLLGEYKPGRSLYTNVEYYAAAIMKALKMDSSLFTPTFTAARIAGWTAHVIEQADNNAIFRPESLYIGPLH